MTGAQSDGLGDVALAGAGPAGEEDVAQVGVTDASLHAAFPAGAKLGLEETPEPGQPGLVEDRAIEDLVEGGTGA